MFFYIKRAISDMVKHRFLHSVTLMTITLSIITISVFGLVVMNTSDMIHSARARFRMSIYLKENVSNNDMFELEKNIKQLYGIQQVQFISKENALSMMKEEMKRQSSIFEHLSHNPLPDAFEVQLSDEIQDMDIIERLAMHLEIMPHVESVEYGQQWFGRWIGVLNLFRFISIAIGVIFIMINVVIMGNTIRLTLYAQRDDIEIMRLIGATDFFIKAPYYITGIIQGALGSIMGLIILYGIVCFISNRIEVQLSSMMISIHFLPLTLCVEIIICSMIVGWLGCYLSLKQYLNN
ncbi:MAG: ABC transporter permease [Desulfobacterales bacterium]|nr:ABC transporter permease [Desulfobacterales bacterium]